MKKVLFVLLMSFFAISITAQNKVNENYDYLQILKSKVGNKLYYTYRYYYNDGSIVVEKFSFSEKKTIARQKAKLNRIKERILMLKEEKSQYENELNRINKKIKKWESVKKEIRANWADGKPPIEKK